MEVAPIFIVTSQLDRPAGISMGNAYGGGNQADQMFDRQAFSPTSQVARYIIIINCLESCPELLA